jgi:ribonuclease P/MRP protein subunit RPP1
MVKGIVLFEQKDFLSLKKIKSKDELAEDNIGYLIENSEEKEIRKIVDKLRDKNKIIAVQAFGNNLNRRILETMKINYLIFPEKVDKRDNIKQRDSGINHVTAKIARDNRIDFLINYSELQKIEGKERALIFARIIQNLKICRKVGAKIKIGSFAKNKKDIVEKKELQEFLLSLGASTIQSKDSVNY